MTVPTPTKVFLPQVFTEDIDSCYLEGLIDSQNRTFYVHNIIPVKKLNSRIEQHRECNIIGLYGRRDECSAEGHGDETERYKKNKGIEWLVLETGPNDSLNATFSNIPAAEDANITYILYDWKRLRKSKYLLEKAYQCVDDGCQNDIKYNSESNISNLMRTSKKYESEHRTKQSEQSVSFYCIMRIFYSFIKIATWTGVLSDSSW